MKEQIEFEDFLKVDVRVGEVVAVVDNEGAKNPAYVLTIDFGTILGMKTTSAQVTENYSKSDLLHKQVLAVVNFPVKRVNGVKSEVLVLAVVSKDHGTILIEPNKPVTNGMPLL